MKIAFWSNAYEKTGAFLNFAAVSIAGVMWYPYTITVFENYLSKCNLGKAFFGGHNLPDGRGGTGSYYEGRGIEGLLRRIYRGDNDPELLESYWQEVIPNHLYYIPQRGVINSELFDYELHYNLNYLINIIEENTDLCYVNLNHKNHLSSNAFLQEADLIVVNLYQNPDYLNDFFKNYSSFKSKAIYIVGNYTPKSMMTCKKMSKLYDISLEDISPIPYNVDFHIACQQGSAKEFINRNYFCEKDNKNYLFIYGIRRAAFIISKKIKQANLIDKKELKPCGI